MTKELDAIVREDGSVFLSGGQVLKQTHKAGTCLGEVCPIHNPTDHELRGKPLILMGKHMARRVGDNVFIDPDDYYFITNGFAIIRNSATCASCGDQLESWHRHDYVTCSCGGISVDGGQEYIRRSFKSADLLIETSIRV